MSNLIITVPFSSWLVSWKYGILTNRKENCFFCMDFIELKYIKKDPCLLTSDCSNAKDFSLLWTLEKKTNPFISIMKSFSFYFIIYLNQLTSLSFLLFFWYCWRSKDELISDVLMWTPSNGRAHVGRLARTYLQQLCMNTGCSQEDLPNAMDDIDDWPEGQVNPCKWHDMMMMMIHTYVHTCMPPMSTYNYTDILPSKCLHKHIHYTSMHIYAYSHTHTYTLINYCA